MKVLLKGIRAEDLLLSYYYLDKENSDEITPVEWEDSISIGDILHENDKNHGKLSFIGPHKSQIKMWPNMFCLNTQGSLPFHTNRPCWWCRNSFTTRPLGCPVKYIQGKVSCKENENYRLWLEESNISQSGDTSHFMTEGIFCTFPCVKSYILRELSCHKSAKYKKSLSYLTLLYKKINGEIMEIPKASSWKLTEMWGGHLTPEELRASTGYIQYVETVNTKRPIMHSSSQYIQEKRVKI